MRQHEPSSVRRAISGVVTTITFILIGAFAPRITTAQAFEFTVNDKADEHDSNVGDVVCGTNSGTCTIRAALEEIAFWAPSCDIFDHVVVPGGRYLLTIPDQLSAVGCVHIAGTGANGKPNATVIDGNGGDGTIHSVRAQRPLYVNPGSSLLLTGVTVRKGHDHTGGGAIRNDGDLRDQDLILITRSEPLPHIQIANHAAP